MLSARIHSNHSPASAQRFGNALALEGEMALGAMKGFKTLARSIEFDAAAALKPMIVGSGLKSIGSIHRLIDVEHGVTNRPLLQQAKQEGLVVATIALATFVMKGFLSKVLPGWADVVIMAGAYEFAERTARKLTHAYDAPEKDKKDEVSTALRTSSLTGSGGAPVVLELDPPPAAASAPLPSVQTPSFQGPLTTASMFAGASASQPNPSFIYPFEFKPAGSISTSSLPAFSFSAEPISSVPSAASMPQVNPFFSAT